MRNADHNPFEVMGSLPKTRKRMWTLAARLAKNEAGNRRCEPRTKDEYETIDSRDP